MNIRLLSIMAAGALCMCACGDGASKKLEAAAAVADSVVSASANANVEVNAASTGLDVTYRMDDSLIHVDAVGQDLFDVVASQVLKSYPVSALNEVKSALEATKGVVTVELSNNILGQSKTFELSSKQMISLQRASLSQLNPGAARQQLCDVALQMVPGGAVNDGCLRVDASIVKSFLEYTFTWPDAKAFEGKDQSLLTSRYFNALKLQYQALGDMGPAIVNLCESLNVDGVRIVYAAEGTDATIRQAFPWREIMKPVVVPEPAKKGK